MSDTHPPNRLIHEKSPYLLQHAHNPVDWFPWGDEAIAKARAEQKPIFLSIGYSTCHWCHVMERESFESAAIAERLNRWFVPVKVDREERPDVDRLYMTAMQALGLGGGWPLNAFLTPDLAPFYGGTYFPPEARHGHAAFADVLERVHEVWEAQRTDIEAQGAQVLDAIRHASARAAAATETDATQRRAMRGRLIDRAFAALARSYDPEHGGFGGAPRFPSVANLNLLVRVATRLRDRRVQALEMQRGQLDAMMNGGLHDHVGGGFHRYATDAEWRVPHFEKMLYDQAQLAWAYLAACSMARVPGPDQDLVRADAYARAARGIFGYVARDLAAPQGAWYSAEDADSEGEEGRFYVWTPAQLVDALGPEDAILFAAAYDVADGGNFEHGASILHRVQDDHALAVRFDVGAGEVATRLERALAKLLAARARRPRPHRDEKVLVAWNGLMISAFARGARVLDDASLAEQAVRAADFLWEELHDPASGSLKRRWAGGESAGEGQLDDYAHFALGCFDLYGATFDPLWLVRAEALLDQALARFWDANDGGFFGSPAGDPHLALRLKDDFDGAELAGNSIAAWLLVMFAELLDRDDWRDRATQLFDFYTARLEHHPAAMPQMLVAMDLEQSPPRHVVIAGDPEARATRELIRAFDREARPRDVLLVLPPAGPARERLARLVPFTAPLSTVAEAPAAYVCRDYSCRLPVTTAGSFAAELATE